MKNIEEKAKAYAKGVVECNSAHKESEGLIHTAYIRGVQDATEENPWRSVDDELPEPRREVLLYNARSIRRYEIGWLRKAKLHYKSRWCLSNGYVEDKDITHWMPIPEQPKTEN